MQLQAVLVSRCARCQTSRILAVAVLAAVAGLIVAPATQAALIDTFDPPNTNVTATQTGSAPGPAVTAGGPSLQFLRLVNDNVNNQRNHYAYDATDLLAAGTQYSTITAKFDFAGFSSNQAADGFSFSLIPTSTYGTTGAGNTGFGEAASAAGTFGVGFRVYPAGTNHVATYWDNAELFRYHVDPTTVSFSNGTWNRAQLDIQSVGPGSYVKLQLIGDVNGTPQNLTVYDRYVLDLTGYENRVQFSARTGGADMNVDLDNIDVQYGAPIAALPSAGAYSGTYQDFDSLGGTPFVLTQSGSSPGPQVTAGGATGNFVRVISKVNNQKNQIAFDRTDPGIYEHIEAQWGFQLDSGADGGAFVLANTTLDGITGAVRNPGAWEVPNISGVFGIGFDVFPNRYGVSLHWDGLQITESTAYDYRNAPHAAQAEIDFVPGGANVTLDLIDASSVVHSIFTDYFIPGMTPYESRVAFGGRTGGANTNFDVDELHVQWSSQIVPTDPFHWLGATGDYHTASLWTNGILPTGSDDAVIGQGMATTSGLNVQGSGSVTVNDTGWLNVSGNLYVADSGGSNGQFFQDSGKVTVSGALRLGVSSGATGAYTMTGGVLEVGSYIIPGASGKGTFTQSGGTVTQTGGGRLILGDHAGSEGIYNLSGGTLSVNSVTLADKAGTTGTFTISGNGTLNSAGDVEVGDGGTGVLNVLGGTANVGSRLIVGVQGGANGAVNHSGGTVNTNSDLYLANASGAVGAYNMSGNAQLTVHGMHTVVGRASGVGHFVQDGGAVSLRRLFIAESWAPGSAGSTYTINGGTLTLSDRMEVGRTEAATFTQTGGTVNVPHADGLIVGNGSVAGVYNLQGGTLNVNVLKKGANGQFNFTGGRLNADTVQFDLTNNGGTLAPGNSPGLTEITGNYVQTAAGTYEVELGGYNGGVDHDLVHVTGTATLDGALDVLLIDPFVPQLGDTFDVLIADGGIIDQGLDVHSLSPQIGGYLYEIVAGAGSTEILRLTAIPEPSTCTLLGLGVIGLLGLGRRRKRRDS